MALTQISTGGVKNDAVTAGKIPANAVGSSEIADDAVDQGAIADEAVDEARLQISNAGTNGQFLSKQTGNTGGLTWSDVPAQYTHPNHSGEVTSTGDGATVITDNIVDEANLKVSNTPTNGQVLSAQSGNTGGLTWTTISAAPEITANASGSVTAGDRLIINTNGTTSPISATFNTLTNPTGTSELNFETGGVDPNSRHAAYDPDNKRFLMVYRSANDDKVYIRAGTVTSGGVFTLGTKTQLSSATNNSTPTCSYAGNGRFVVMYKDNGNGFRPGARIVTVDSNLAFSIGSNTELDGSGMYLNPACQYDPDNDKVLFAWNDNSSIHLHVKSYTCSGGSFSNASSKYTLENGLNQQYMGGNGTGNWIAHDPDTGRMIVMYKGGNSTSTMNAYYAKVLQLSGTNITIGSRQTIATGTQGYLNWGFSVTYDTGANKLGFAYQFENNVVYARVGTVTGGSTNTISFGTALTVLSEDSVYFVLTGTGHSAFSMFIRKPSDSNYGYLIGLGISGTSLSASNQTKVVGSNSAEFFDAFLTENGQTVALYKHGSGDSKLITGNVSTETTDAAGYVGIANNTASNGNNVTIRTFGATNDNQSSLTVGSLYFIQKNGSLSTTADDPKVEAGIALSSTKLLIKG